MNILEIITEKTFIIAEIGINHNGDLDLAKQMIFEAKNCGADAVKFQTFRAEEFMSDRDITYSYINNGNIITESMFEMFKRLELPLDYYKILFEYALSLNITPFTSIADSTSFDLINNIGLPILKLASEDLINIDLLEYIKDYQKPVILSTGMANEFEITNALKYFQNKENLILLHCVSLYPTPLQKLNLSRITSLKEKYGFITGFSDHSKSLISGALAVGLGAQVIEKHFTLDNKLNGPDQEFSLNPSDFIQYVANIRQAELMMGSRKIDPENEEKEAANIFRRGITLACDMNAGDVVRKEHLLYQRPCPDYKPYQILEVLNKSINKDLKKGHKLTKHDF